MLMISNQAQVIQFVRADDELVAVDAQDTHFDAGRQLFAAAAAGAPGLAFDLYLTALIVHLFQSDRHESDQPVNIGERWRCVLGEELAKNLPRRNEKHERRARKNADLPAKAEIQSRHDRRRSEEHTSELQSPTNLVC